MATIENQVIADVETTLESLVGVGLPLKSVQRWRQDGNSFLDLPTVVIEQGDLRAPEEQISGRERWVLTLPLLLAAQHDETANPESTDEYLGELWGTLRDAIVADGSRGGLAAWTHVVERVAVKFVSDNPMVGWKAMVEILFDHDEFDASALP